MPELSVLHFTDLHDDWYKLDLLKEYLAAHSVDAVFFTGDYIQGHQNNTGKTADFMVVKANGVLKESGLQGVNAEIQAFVQENKIAVNDEGKITSTLTEEQKAGLSELLEKRQPFFEQAGNAAIPIIESSYHKTAQKLKAIAEKAPIYGVLGNHDLTFAYDSLEGIVQHLEGTAPIKIKGKTGIEFTVAGDLNSWEVPPLYGHQIFSSSLSPHFVNYQSGFSLAHAEQQLADQKTKPEEKAGLEQLKTYLTNFYQQERERLGDKESIDIYLTHKLPHCSWTGTPQHPIEGDICDITLEYGNAAKAVYGGHLHDGQVGKKSLPKLLAAVNAAEGLEKVVVDGTEIPVYYLEKDEPWELNPGENYFTVTEYNAQKWVECVTVYRFVE